jgi:hypothetical protein
VCPTVLGIDEHFFTRKKGFATTLCDLLNHTIYDVVLGRSEASLEAYLQGLQGRNAVKVVCMDLSATYRAVVKKYFPNARIVAEDGTRCGQPPIEGPRGPRPDCQLWGNPSVLPKEGFRRPDPKIRIVGNLERATPGALRQATFGASLDAPGDPPEQKLLVVGPRFLAEHFDVLAAQLADRHPAQLLDLLRHVGTQIILLSQCR